MPLLTVVIPVYNNEKYLRECLDSVVNQTYKNLEIIIVNDCSPDNSEEIVLEYQANDSRIKYIKHETNLGSGGARNTGITNATGEWITFVDEDDYIDLDTYEYMMDLILKNDVDMGIFSAVYFDDITKKESYDTYFDTPNLVKLSNENFLDVINATVWNKIFRLSDIVDNGVYFPEHLKSQDEAFWFKYVATVEPSVIGCSKRFYHYRIHPHSATKQSTYRVNIIKVIHDIYDFLIAHDKFELYKHCLLKKFSHEMLSPYFTIDDHTKIKILQDSKDFLNSSIITDDDLMLYPELFATKNLPINEHSLEFLKELRKFQDSNNYLRNDKWYRFGHLSRTQKIKFIIKTIIKKILKKLHLFEFIKKLLKR